jgi:hypothetical protein
MVEQSLIHETGGFFQLKSKKKTFCTFVNFITKFKTKNWCKTAKYVIFKMVEKFSRTRAELVPSPRNGAPRCWLGDKTLVEEVASASSFLTLLYKTTINYLPIKGSTVIR